MTNNFNPELDIAHYSCLRTRSPITIDGKLDEAAWSKALRSPRFIDIVGGTPAIYDTRSALLWDEKYLYIAFWCEEPFVEAHLTERDSHVWSENDIEVFIDGGDTYYELQINALNTNYEAFYIWKDAYKKGARFDVPEFDLLDKDTLVFGGNTDRYLLNHFARGEHPRGNRWTFLNWDFPGLKTAVFINGKINDSLAIDEGWTVELAFPWEGLKWLSGGKSLPPSQGDIWKLFLGRYEKLDMNGTKIYTGWSWNKIGIPDNHYPERFTNIHFSCRYVEDM